MGKIIIVCYSEKCEEALSFCRLCDKAVISCCFNTSFFIDPAGHYATKNDSRRFTLADYFTPLGGRNGGFSTVFFRYLDGWVGLLSPMVLPRAMVA